MKILVQHIENLLPEHDCVVVPGLGGFVQNEVHARIQTESSLFHPATKEICFNPKLKFNDGLLAQSYQEIHGMSFEEANQQIHSAVQEVITKMEEGKYVRFGRIGTLSRNEGQLIFRPDQKNHFLPDAYGLSAFTFPTLQVAVKPITLSKKEQRLKLRDLRRQELVNASILTEALNAHGLGPAKDDFIHITLHRERFRQAVLGVAACLFFVLLSKPAGHQPDAGQEASMLHNNFIALSSPSQPSLDLEPATESITQAMPISQAESGLVASDPIEIVPEDVQAVPETKTQVLSKPEKRVLVTEVKENGYINRPESTLISKLQETLSVQKPSVSDVKVSKSTYYIIISTFSQKSTAETWLAQHAGEPALNGASVVNINGWYRVSTKSFNTLPDANTHLNQFTSSYPEYGSAWIYNYESR